jgi:hypothetical protein
MGNTGREEPVYPDEPQKRLTSLAESLKAPLRHLFPEIPRIPAEKAPKQIYLTHPKASSYQLFRRVLLERNIPMFF